MRWLASTIVALGTLAGASTTPVLAAAAPGPATKSMIPSTSQVEHVRGWGHHHHGFGHGFGRGFGGIYIGPGYGFYGGPYYGYGDGYYDDDYYDYGPTYYAPRYRYRSYGHRRGNWGHRHYRRHHRR